MRIQRQPSLKAAAWATIFRLMAFSRPRLVALPVVDDDTRTAASARQDPDVADAEMLDAYSHAVTGVVAQVAPAVAHIRVERAVRGRGAQAGSGSGFIITPDGYMVTNSHVAGGGSAFEVTLPDGRVVAAELVGDEARAAIPIRQDPRATEAEMLDAYSTAVTGVVDGSAQLSAIAVEQETPGYTRAPRYRKLGWHASDTRELSFVDCHVPEANLIGTEGDGFRQFLQILESGRVAIAALSVGLAQACLDASVAHSAARRQFGQQIAAFQATQFKLADMATQIELSRLMTWRAASAIDAGKDPTPYASMAKLHASEVATACANQAVQIHGGSGFMEDSPVARYYRDAKANEIGEGTSEVQRILIARHLLADLLVD